MRKTVIYLFHTLFVLVPLFFSTKNDELFEFNKIILTYGITILIACAWIARMIYEKKILWKRTPFDVPIFFFLLSQVFSTVLSIHPRTSFFGYYSRFNGGLLSIIAYIILYYAFVNNVYKKDLKPFLRSLVYGALLVSLYAIPEHFGRSPSCFLISKEFNVDCWIQDVKTRVFATFGQPNWLAAYVIMIIPVSFSLALQEHKKKFSFALYLCASTLFYITLLFTKSRSGVVGLSIGMSVFFGLQFLHWIKIKEIKTQIKKLMLPAAGFGIVCLFFTIVFGQFLSPSFESAIKKIIHAPQIVEQQTENPAQPIVGTQLEVGGTESGVIRSIVWKGAIQVWKRYPIFGSGLETFAYSYYKDRPIEHNFVSEWDFLYNKAHNEFLNYLATTGIVGFSLYLFLIFSVYGWGMIYILRKQKPSYLASAWLAAFTGLHVSNFFGFSTVVVSILFYLTPAVLIVSFSKQEKKDFIKKHAFSIPQWAGFSITGFFTLILLTKVANYWLADSAFASAKQHVKLSQTAPAITAFQKAITLSSNEAIYHDELSSFYAQLAVAFALREESTLAAQLAQYALDESDKTITLNPVHLNFYKSRARILIILSQLEPSLLTEAKRILLAAQELAPTDPKIVFNLGAVSLQMEEKEQAKLFFQKTLELKPDYDSAKQQLDTLLSTPN